MVGNVPGSIRQPELLTSSVARMLLLYSGLKMPDQHEAHESTCKSGPLVCSMRAHVSQALLCGAWGLTTIVSSDAEEDSHVLTKKDDGHGEPILERVGQRRHTERRVVVPGMDQVARLA